MIDFGRNLIVFLCIMVENYWCGRNLAFLFTYLFIENGEIILFLVELSSFFKLRIVGFGLYVVIFN